MGICTNKIRLLGVSELARKRITKHETVNSSNGNVHPVKILMNILPFFQALSFGQLGQCLRGICSRVNGTDTLLKQLHGSKDCNRVAHFHRFLERGIGEHAISVFGSDAVSKGLRGLSLRSALDFEAPTD